MSPTPPVNPPPPVAPHIPELMPVHPSRYTAGFWRRGFALLVDSLALGVIGVVLGFTFFDAFARLGAQGRWIGFVVAGAYFGFMNSRIGRGQTLGKRLLEIEVIDLAGEHVRLARSLVRFAIPGFAFELYPAVLPASATFSGVSMVVGFLALIIALTTIYLYVFNSRSRRTLHDFVVGTYVVKKEGSGAPTLYPFWRGHVVILVLISILFAGGGYMIARKVKTFAPGMTDAYAAVLATGKVRSASLFAGTTWTSHNGENTTTTSVTCTAYWKHRPTAYEAAAKEIAAVVLKNYPAATEKDALVVQIVYGYDIGIAHGWLSEGFQHTPKEWKTLVAAPKFAAKTP